MDERYLSENSRVFMELGSVWVKALAAQPGGFTALSYHPPERRIRAKACTLTPAGSRATLRITTDRGTYEVGASQHARLASGSVMPVAELRPGLQLQAGVLKNQDGTISVETVYRDIWLHELLEADTQGYKLQLTELPTPPAPSSQRVLRVEPGPDARCFSIAIDCRTSGDPSPSSGHNLLLWPDGTSFGSGIFVY